MFFKVVYPPVISTILQDTRLARLLQIWVKEPGIIQNIANNDYICQYELSQELTEFGQERTNHTTGTFYTKQRHTVMQINTFSKFEKYIRD